jgi:hypothetical protein
MSRTRLAYAFLAITISISALLAQDEAVVDTSPENAQARFRVTGRVVDDLTATVLSGVTVRLDVMVMHSSSLICVECDPRPSPPPKPEPAREVVFGRDGRFAFDNVPGRNVSITATKPGYLVGPPVRRHVDDPLGVYLISDKTGPITLQLTPAASISGVLRDHKGLPVAKDANVTLWCVRSWAGWPRLEYCNFADLDANGGYEFRGLWPGRYYLVANPPINRDPEPARDAKGHAIGEVPVRYPAPRTEHPNPFFTLHEGENARINFRLPQKILHHMSATVTACQSCAYDVVDENGSKAYLFSPIFGEHLEAWLPNGSYRLETWGTDVSGPSPFDIKDCDLSGLSFSISSSERIEIPVEISSLRPFAPNCPREVPRCGFVLVNLVRLLPGGYVEVVSNTTHAGRFDSTPEQQSDSASVIPGTYTVTVSVTPTLNLYAKSVKSGTVDLSTETLTIRSGDEPQPIHIALAEGAVVEGLIQRDGQPSRAWVYTIAEDTDPKTDFREFQPVTSEPNGEFRIEGLAPGSYLFLASDIELPLNVHDPAEVDYWRSRGKVIRVAAGKTAKLVLAVADDLKVP